MRCRERKVSIRGFVRQDALVSSSQKQLSKLSITNRVVWGSLVILLFCSCDRANLQGDSLPHSFIVADSLYHVSSYEQAAKLYSMVADGCKGQESLQSLCYFRSGVVYDHLEQRGRAIANYRKALLIAPDYLEARHNLRLAEQARMNMPSMEYPLKRRWVDAWAYAIPMAGWLGCGVFLFIGAVISCLGFFFGGSRGVRRGSFYAMLALLLLWGSVFLIILHRQYYDAQPGEAILCGAKASLYALEDDPAEATPMMELYDGAEMRIKSTIESDNRRNYLQVVLPDGTEGWIESSAIERVTTK